MTTFLDGPAQFQTLLLRRAPFFLRVTQSGPKEFDALDQPGDEPKPGELLFAYRRRSVNGSVHIRAKGDAKGFYPIAVYEILSEQPDEITIADGVLWRNWCEANAERFGFQR